MLVAPKELCILGEVNLKSSSLVAPERYNGVHFQLPVNINGSYSPLSMHQGQCKSLCEQPAIVRQRATLAAIFEGRVCDAPDGTQGTCAEGKSGCGQAIHKLISSGLCISEWRSDAWLKINLCMQAVLALLVHALALWISQLCCLFASLPSFLMQIMPAYAVLTFYHN